MAKNTAYVCQSCGHEALRWAGQCGGCGEWNTLVEAPRETAKPRGGRPPGSRQGRSREAGRAPRRLGARDRAPADRDRRAGPRAGRRPRAGLAGAPGRVARHRQVDDHRDGPRQHGRGGPPHALRLRRGVGRTGPHARAEAGGGGARRSRRHRDLPRERPRHARGRAARRLRHRLDPDAALARG